MWALQLLLVGLSLGRANAQNIIERLSFGHKQPISDNQFSIPGWSLLGEGHVPQILSDKVVVTPPVGGNKRGALWTENKNTQDQWTLAVDFRVNGDERAGGNMNIWYLRDGPSTVSTGSVYTTSKFEGLVIVVDTVGGVQKIRGFLNDGSTDYKGQQSIEGLAFGHCDYRYRGLGRPSQLQIMHSTSGLEVRIDNQPCFSTSRVRLPTEYNFGLTAASSDPPDSFEVYRFQLNASGPGAGMPGRRLRGDSPNTVPEPEYRAAAEFATSGAQFTDLHSRLHVLSETMHNLLEEIKRQAGVADARQQEIIRQFGTSQSAGNIDSRLSNLERLIADLHSDHKSTDHRGQYEKLSQQIQSSHAGLTEHLPNRMREYVQNHTPRIGFIAFSFMAFQSVCLAILLWQKYRKSTMPKKYL